MGAKQSSKAKERLDWYEQRLKEIDVLSDFRKRWELAETFLSELEIETSAMEVKKGFEMPMEMGESLKKRCRSLIQKCELDNLQPLGSKDPLELPYEMGPPSEKYYKPFLGDYIDMLFSNLHPEILFLEKERYRFKFEQHRDTMKCKGLLNELTKLSEDQSFKKDDAAFERKITAAKREFENLKFFYNKDLFLKIYAEISRLEKSLIGLMLSNLTPEIRSLIEEQYLTTYEHLYRIVKCYELTCKLAELNVPNYKRQINRFEREMAEVRQELEEIELNHTIDSYHKQDIITRMHGELRRLNDQYFDPLVKHLSPEIPSLTHGEELTNVKQFKEVQNYYKLLTKLIKMKAPIYRREEAPFERQITAARQEVEKVKSNQTIDEFHKHDIISRIETELQRLDREVTDQFLNGEIRGSINLIEKTLEEPYLYTLPTLIMWRNTAQDKIQKLDNSPKPIPLELWQALTRKYESLITQLKDEILKLRTYPIPEAWRSHCMREGLTHLIEGEFIFFVHPGIEEDMRPLNLSDRDLLPGGLPRKEYDSRMERLSKDASMAKGVLETRKAGGMVRKLKWIEDAVSQIESRVNFVTEELPLLHRDGRSLAYLVNKNQDDRLLQEIHDLLLRRIRHFRSNRIHIPSVAISFYVEPILIAPPKAERNIPIASGVDRGATEGLQLVTPASVVVFDNSVFVADKVGHALSWHRDTDLVAFNSYLIPNRDSPVSLTLFKNILYICYANTLVECSLSVGNTFENKGIASIEIPEICCTSSNNFSLFVGTLRPSLVLIGTDTFLVEQEYRLYPMRYHNKNRYPWLQDMKATNDTIICLFTGSPSPLQEFSFKGELIRSILREDKIVGAYHFSLFVDPVIFRRRIYITDFWDSSIKVFDMNGEFIETFSEKGFGLGQIFHPTGIP